jgi:hypothetical protein
VAVGPRIVTAPSGEQTLIYQTKDGRIKAERINPVKPSSRRAWEPEF